MKGSVEGFDKVIKRLNDEILGIKNRGFDGLLEAGLKIEAASNKRAPRDTGNMVGSSYARKAQDGSLSVEVGYGAAYAAAVHEMPMTLKGKPRAHFGITSNHSDYGPKVPQKFGGGTGNGTYWSPNGENKFLEKTVRQNEKAIVDIIRARAQVSR